MTNGKLTYLTLLSLLLVSCKSGATIENKVVEQAAPLVLPEEILDDGGEPGPIFLQLKEHFPTHVFTFAANKNHFAVAYQSNVGDIAQCTKTGLNICFKAYLTVATRENPTKYNTVELYEADTVSEASVRDLVAFDDGFAMLVRNGLYVGDEFSVTYLRVDNRGNISQRIKLNTDNPVGNVALAAMKDGSAFACHTAFDVVNDEVDFSKNSLHCAVIDKQGVIGKVLTKNFPKNVRRLAVSVDKKNQAVIAYNLDGKSFALMRNANHTFGKNIELGDSVDYKPVILRRQSGLYIAVHDQLTHFKIFRLLPDALQIHSQTTVKSFDFQSSAGLISLPDALLFAAHNGKNTDFYAMRPDLKSMSGVSGQSPQRILSDNGILNIQDAHTGKFFWQSPVSLIQKRKVAEVADSPE